MHIGLIFSLIGVASFISYGYYVKFFNGLLFSNKYLNTLFSVGPLLSVIYILYKMYGYIGLWIILIFIIFSFLANFLLFDKNSKPIIPINNLFITTIILGFLVMLIALICFFI